MKKLPSADRKIRQARSLTRGCTSTPGGSLSFVKTIKEAMATSLSVNHVKATRCGCSAQAVTVTHGHHRVRQRAVEPYPVFCGGTGASTKVPGATTHPPDAQRDADGKRQAFELARRAKGYRAVHLAQLPLEVMSKAELRVRVTLAQAAKNRPSFALGSVLTRGNSYDVKASAPERGDCHACCATISSMETPEARACGAPADSVAACSMA